MQNDEQTHAIAEKFVPELFQQATAGFNFTEIRNLDGEVAVMIVPTRH